MRPLRSALALYFWSRWELDKPFRHVSQYGQSILHKRVLSRVAWFLSRLFVLNTDNDTNFTGQVLRQPTIGCFGDVIIRTVRQVRTYPSIGKLLDMIQQTIP